MTVLLKNLEVAESSREEVEGAAGGLALLSEALLTCSAECCEETLLWGPSHFIHPLQGLRTLGQLRAFSRE